MISYPNYPTYGTYAGYASDRLWHDLEVARARHGSNLGLPDDHIALGWIERLERELEKAGIDEEEDAEFREEVAEQILDLQQQVAALKAQLAGKALKPKGLKLIKPPTQATPPTPPTPTQPSAGAPT